MKLSTVILIGLIALVGQGCGSSQTRFASPDEAVQSLVGAMRAHDSAQLKNILGSESDDLLNSGDEVADRAAGERFLASYDAKHSLETSVDDDVTLVIGEKEWPMPIPLVRDGSGKWYFDTDAGKEEIINRRIGRNELNVIKVCEALGDAEREYVQHDRNADGIPEYAQKFISTEGKHDGLYWKTKEGEPPSPLGELVSQAIEQGYSAECADGSPPKAYHGYYYRILTGQGPSAPGGEMSYLVNGRLIGGFAFIAWPAEYGNSGVMTFIVNHEGTVYQSDLGENTDELAKAIKAYDPGQEWKKAE